MRVDVNEILCYRKLLCAIVEQADLDIKSDKVLDDMYKQAEVEFAKQTAFCWVFEKHEYALRFEDVCNALGLDSERILTLYQQRYEKYKAVPRVDLRSLRKPTRKQKAEKPAKRHVNMALRNVQYLREEWLRDTIKRFWSL